MTYGYDSNGNLVTANKLIDSSNPIDLVYATNSYTYGNPQFPHYITGVQNPRGVTTLRSEYDSQGRLVGIIDAFGNVTAVQHNLTAQTETVYDRLGNPTLSAYDSRGNIVVQVDALGGVTQFAYDLNNNKTMQVDPLGNTNLYTYDAVGNQLTHTDPLGKVTVNTYDNNSHLLTTTDPLGHTTINAYDSGGNRISTTDAAGNVTSYTYDAANNMSSVTDAAGNVTSYAYDSQGNRIQQTDPLGNVTTYRYDANGYQVGQSAIVSVALASSAPMSSRPRIMLMVSPLPPLMPPATLRSGNMTPPTTRQRLWMHRATAQCSIMTTRITLCRGFMPTAPAPVIPMMLAGGRFLQPTAPGEPLITHTMRSTG